MNETSWWQRINHGELAQGDWLPRCLMPVFLGESRLQDPDESVEEDLFYSDLIIVTQSCDLENGRAIFAALCSISTLAEFESFNEKARKKGWWEQVRKGRVEGLHLLASPENPANNRDALVVDFGQIVSLPAGYLQDHAGRVGDRWRLASPFLEHFSQSFARFFMRVGLPSSIPPFGK